MTQRRKHFPTAKWQIAANSQDSAFIQAVNLHTSLSYLSHNTNVVAEYETLLHELMTHRIL